MSRKRTSRRVFLKLLAAGTAAALASPASSLAATRRRSTRAGAPTPAPARAAGGHVALPAEIEKQRKTTAASLKVLRDYALPAGSPQAFSFRPLKARRGRRSS
jgi:hypothetical protein